MVYLRKFIHRSVEAFSVVDVDVVSALRALTIFTSDRVTGARPTAAAAALKYCHQLTFSTPNTAASMALTAKFNNELIRISILSSTINHPYASYLFSNNNFSLFDEVSENAWILYIR